MKRTLRMGCVVTALASLAGCVAPPIVSIAERDPAEIAAVADQHRLPTLPGRSLLEEYRQSTVELVPQDYVASPVPQQLPIEMPRVAFKQATLEPIGQDNNQAVSLQRIKPIQEISLDIVPPPLFTEQQQPMAMPKNEGVAALPLMAQDRPFTRGALVAAGYQWHPSPDGLQFCYQPLYFEEVNLERYGRSFGILQPAVSAAAFWGRVPLLPYMAFARPARRCTMHAHWTLPGYKIPQWEPQPIVPSVHGSAAEVAAIYGIILLIP